MDVEIRLARPEEFAAVGELTAWAYLVDGFLPADHDYVGELRDAASRASGAVLLVAANEDGRVLGTVTLCLPGSSYLEIARAGEAEFRMLAVDPSVRRQGIAAALVTECMRRAADAGCDALVLSSAVTMTAAHRLYERLGFTRDPSRDWVPAPGYPLLAYTRPLHDFVPHSAAS